VATNAEISRFGKFVQYSSVAVDGANYVVASSRQAWFIANSSGTYFGQAMTAGHIYSVAGNGLRGFAGDGGPATSAEFGNPAAGVAVDAAGNLVIADTQNSRIRVVAATTGTFYGQAMTAGDVYTVAGGGTAGLGDGGPATAAEVDQPEGVTVDGAGNLVIADSFDARIRVVAATTGTFYGQAMTAGDIYTVAGNGTSGFSGDRGLATAARLRTPGDVAVDAAGNLVIADSLNQRIRVVAATTGKFYRRPMTAGHIYTVAGIGTGGASSGFSGDGGPANKAKLAFPDGVAVDGSGNLVIADTANSRVRVIAEKTGTFYGQPMTAGNIYTVAGKGNLPLGGCSPSGNGGPATAAMLCEPEGVAVDHAGNLVIADSGNALVRVVTP
jgi:sugar lactone lactonase YvrE